MKGGSGAEKGCCSPTLDVVALSLHDELEVVLKEVVKKTPYSICSRFLYLISVMKNKI